MHTVIYLAKVYIHRQERYFIRPTACRPSIHIYQIPSSPYQRRIQLRRFFLCHRLDQRVDFFKVRNLLKMINFWVGEVSTLIFGFTNSTIYIRLSSSSMTKISTWLFTGLKNDVGLNLHTSDVLIHSYEQRKNIYNLVKSTKILKHLLEHN